MFLRGIALSLTAVFALGLIGAEASADDRKKRRVYVDDGYYYEGPAFIRRVPGLRIFFGDYALTEEEFDALYGNEKPAKRKPAEKKKTAAKPAKPAKKDAGEQTASIDKAEEKAAPVTKKAPAAAGLSCEKAASVVSGYGFSGVTPQTCTGKVYAFNATRDGKTFSVKLDPASGELKEVKKLP